MTVLLPRPHAPSGYVTTPYALSLAANARPSIVEPDRTSPQQNKGLPGPIPLGPCGLPLDPVDPTTSWSDADSDTDRVSHSGVPVGGVITTTAELSGFEDDEDLGNTEGGEEEDVEDEFDDFDDIDDEDFDDDFDDDFEEELDDDYEIEIEDEISAEFGLSGVEDVDIDDLDDVDALEDDVDEIEPLDDDAKG